jgi:pSer/pThr/pTyr-binding forkhead associated (FHA) protein
MDNVFSLRNLGSLDTYTLDKQTTVMGRKPDCDLVIDSEESSREHAVLKLEGDQLILEDLGSTNGTYLNNVRIRSRSPAKGGDVIGIGGQRFRVIAPSSSSNTTMIGAKTVDESSFVLEKDSPESTAIRQRYVMPPGWKSDEREGFAGSRSRFEQEMDQRLQNGKSRFPARHSVHRPPARSRRPKLATLCVARRVEP